MTSKRVVLTGYEPWAHASSNPTLDLLGRAKERNLPNIELFTIPVPIEDGKISTIVDEALNEYMPEVWVSLGLYPGLSVIGIERTAANVRDFPVSDNVGSQPIDEPIFSEGPYAYKATLPVKAIVKTLTQHAIPAKVSNSASTYLCNQIMYSALHLIDKKNMNCRAGFIHVPYTPEHVAGASYPEHEYPSMSLDLMEDAVCFSLITAAEHDEDIHAPPKGY